MVLGTFRSECFTLHKKRRLLFILVFVFVGTTSQGHYRLHTKAISMVLQISEVIEALS